jgi:hypothetical protein
VRGVVHVIEEMELDTKFKKAIDKVKTATLDLGIAKMAYKNELKKEEGDDTTSQAFTAGKVTPDNA